MHAIVICKFLTIRIDVTRYVKARSHINFQIKTLEKYQISGIWGRTVFFHFQKKTIFANKIEQFFKKLINF